MKTTGNTILLTGGTSGVGLALLERLYEAGNRLLVVGRNREKIAELAPRYPEARFMACNLSSEADLQQLILTLQTDFPDCNVLINNAGVQFNYRLGDDPEAYSRIESEIRTNLTAAVQLCEALLPGFRRQPEAAILNITSGLALSPKRSAPVYCATKAGLRIFTKALRYQLEGTPVRVMEVMLPLVDTPMTSGRGRGKISPEQAADEILRGWEADRPEIYVGKAGMFRWIYRLAPALADRMLRNG
ncbi:SDR family oxidoreductase [Larkinella soli]|uniref:SDR family oxidoreductase n=1 Tax=Larkinella soli TaxID=1770527 RepID=UPI000FFBE6E4|nr:SDR family NAD(P)-dependent oxidoreductase [Larkinella soli]